MKPLILSLALVALSLPCLASAQDTPVVHAPVPDAAPPAPVPPLVVAPPPVVAEPPARALVDYSAKHLEIHPAWAFAPYSPVRVGVRWGTGGFYGPRSHWHVGVGVPVVAPPLNASQPWAVFQQQKRLTVPEYLGVVGDSVQAQALDHDIRQAKTWSNVFLGVAGAGAVTAVAGIVQASAAHDRFEYDNAMGIATLGGLGIVGGLIGRSLSSAHAFELQNDFKESLTFSETEAAVEAYNAQLRKDLGLREEDTGRAPRVR